MEGKLRPDYHYIEVKEDFSDLEEKLNYYIAHPEEAQHDHHVMPMSLLPSSVIRSARN